MKKFTLFFVLLLLTTSAQAKIIVIASHGGKDVRLPGDGLAYSAEDTGFEYDPISRYYGMLAKEVVSIEEPGNSGGGVLPALPIALASSSQSVVARISGLTGDTSNMEAWFYNESGYVAGDMVVLVGYSAGGPFVRKLAQKLSHVQIDAMLLIDPYLTDEEANVPTNVANLANFYQRNFREIRNSSALFGRDFIETSGSTKVFPGHPREVSQYNHVNIDNSEEILDDLTSKIILLSRGEIHKTTFGEQYAARRSSVGSLLDSGLSWLRDGILNLIVNPPNGLGTSLPTGFSISQIDRLMVDVSIDQQERVAYVHLEGYSRIHLLNIPSYVDIEVIELDTSGQGDGNISIERFFIREQGWSAFTREAVVALPAGLSTVIEGEALIANKGGTKIDDANIKYRVDRNNAKFDEGDTRVDRDIESLDPGVTITKHMRGVRIHASLDKSYIDIYDNGGAFQETFYADRNGNVKIYFFLDVEGGGDRDISTTHSGDKEYGVLTIRILDPPTFNLVWGMMQSGSTKQGDLWTLRVDLTNDTDYDSPSVVVDYYSDGDFLKAVTIPSLNVGETKQLKLSHRSGIVGQEVKKACLSLSRNSFNLTNPGGCSPSGILTVNHRPKPPTGGITSHDCNIFKGNVSDPNGTRNLDVYIYDQGGYIGKTRANSSGSFTYSIANRRNGISYTYRVYAIDDRKGGYAGNQRIGTVTKKCHPHGVVDIKRATNLRSESYYLTTNHDNLRGNSEWRIEGVVFKAYHPTTWRPGTRVLYANWHGGRRSHLISSSPTEGSSSGYRRGHPIMRCMTSQVPGTKPLYRMYKHAKRSHRAAQDAKVIRGSQNSGFTKEGPLCYVWPVTQG